MGEGGHRSLCSCFQRLYFMVTESMRQNPCDSESLEFLFADGFACIGGYALSCFTSPDRSNFPLTVVSQDC